MSLEAMKADVMGQYRGEYDIVSNSFQNGYFVSIQQDRRFAYAKAGCTQCFKTFGTAGDKRHGYTLESIAANAQNGVPHAPGCSLSSTSVPTPAAPPQTGGPSYYIGATWRF